MFTDNVSLCVVIITLTRRALLRDDKNAVEIYSNMMKHFIRTRGLTVKDCDRAMRMVQSVYHSKPTVKMNTVQYGT